MPWFSAWMRRLRSRHWTAWTRCCRFRQAVLSVTDLSISGIELFRCMQHSTPRPVLCLGKTTDKRSYSHDFHQTTQRGQAETAQTKRIDQDLYGGALNERS